MGAALIALGCCSNRTVQLHIYDLSGSRMVSHANKLFRSLGTGVFHAAVEVYGLEWSFGFSPSGSGVFCCPPKTCELHHYRESIDLGITDVSEEDFDRIVERLKLRWQGRHYDMLYQNCCHFCDNLAKALGVDPLPDWVNNLAAAGATLDRGFKWAVNPWDSVDDELTAEIIEAAKSGNINPYYTDSRLGETRVLTMFAQAGAMERSDSFSATSGIMFEMGQVVSRTFSGRTCTL